MNRIGIDRTVIAGFRIIRINYEKLQRHENVVIDREGVYTYQLIDGSSFRWLKIEDYNMFGVLCAGTRKTDRMKQDYSRMDIVVGHTQQGNLQNLSVEEYKEKIVDVFRYLYEEYGITVRLDCLRFSEMEINCTFELQDEFYKYHRVLRLMMFNLPNSFKKLGQILGVNKEEGRVDAETFYRGNASMEVKIYDKKKHLAQTIQFVSEKNIMRIEFVLKSPQKIRESFKTEKVFDLTDVKLNEFYYKQFLRLIENPYKKWQIENGKKLRDMILFHKKRNRNYWKSNLLRECGNREQLDQIPLLLDVKDLLLQVRMLEQEGHYARIERGILEQCSYNDVYLQKDADKAEEIIGRVHEAYKNYLLQIESATALNTATNGEVA